MAMCRVFSYCGAVFTRLKKLLEVNQVIAKRFVKHQQMQWCKKGTHLLLQARTKVLNEEWDECFRVCFSCFRPPAIVPIQMAA